MKYEKIYFNILACERNPSHTRLTYAFLLNEHHIPFIGQANAKWQRANWILYSLFEYTLVWDFQDTANNKSKQKKNETKQNK